MSDECSQQNDSGYFCTHHVKDSYGREFHVAWGTEELRTNERGETDLCVIVWPVDPDHKLPWETQ